MLDKNFLPIGTVVRINDVKLMIYGYLAQSDSGIINQYFGCIYPLGMIEINKGICFNNEDIDEILYMGYKPANYDERISKYKKDYDKFVDITNESIEDVKDLLMYMADGLSLEDAEKNIELKKENIDIG